MSHPIWYQSLKLLPKNTVSRLMGSVAQTRFPKPIVQAQIKAFARRFDIDIEESAQPIESFGCLQEFFTRALKEGARPIDQAPEAMVSPCDGSWGQSGIVHDGLLMQVKGKDYRLVSLLGDNEWALKCEKGMYATFYLSPRDYHRFHAPCDVHVLDAVHLPGHLWPVNLKAVQSVDDLFCVNERIIIVMQPVHAPTERLYMVAVGATMVGKVHVNFDVGLTTNVAQMGPRRKNYGIQKPFFAKGAELGRFEFGSTVVMIATKGLCLLDLQPQGTSLRLGEKIGTLL